jgi:hypothetical protein
MLSLMSDEVSCVDIVGINVPYFIAALMLKSFYLFYLQEP